MDIQDWLKTLPEWSLPALMVLGLFLGLEIIKRFILNRLLKLAQKNNFHRSRIILKSFGLPMTFSFMALSMIVFEHLMQRHGLDMGGSLLTTLAQVLLVVAIVLLVDKIITGFVSSYAEQNNSLKTSKGIMQGISHIIVLGLGLLIVLSTLGVSITPVIASLGITSLAVALALQPTLENFFSGVQMVIDKPIRVGDFIELDSGEQGFVQKIGWRTTWVRMLPNNVVILPNGLLSKSKLINYYYPEKELSVPVEVGVHYNSDLEHVERVTLEVARKILKEHKWGVSDYNTFVVYHTFDNSSINFTVMLRAEEYFNRFFIKSAFIKALHKRYAEEGITIPYPIRAINYDQESTKDK